MLRGWSWTVWSYKATSGLIPNSWGLYDPNHWATTPNISTDSAATIADWQQWTTPATFSLNTALGLRGNQNGGATTISTSAWYNLVNTNSGSCVDAANPPRRTEPQSNSGHAARSKPTRNGSYSRWATATTASRNAPRPAKSSTSPTRERRTAA